MSPVSRGRKSKKAKKRGPTPPRAARSLSVADVMPAMADLFGLGGRTRPAWFDPAIKTVLDGAVTLGSANGPRELEQMTAELLGAELHRVVQGDHDGLWFSWWFEELISATREQAGEDAVLLLHGLASVGTPACASIAVAALRKLRNAGGPAWLDDLLSPVATGEVYRMRDAYGTRFAVLAGFSYGQGGTPLVFLFDIDAADAIVRLVRADVFDDVDQAAAAWLADIGDTAGETTPRPVAEPSELLCLTHLDIGEDSIFGDESRVVMDNWFRAQRRVRDLAEALKARGTSLPSAGSLYHDLDLTPMADEFTSWYAGKRGEQPDPEGVDGLVEQWMEGALPETWYAVSPGRIAVQATLIRDSIPDHPVTLAVKSLLPDWLAWLIERADLPEHLREGVEINARVATAELDR
ncbi:MAG: hypothetical protein WBA97_26585 [Actinophytocola sp.]|uniref:hypothetical protein n=1 Tax=Actinophytocola sp. TaxID=1872138 RepID=UPI003C793043